MGLGGLLRSLLPCAALGLESWELLEVRDGAPLEELLAPAASSHPAARLLRESPGTEEVQLTAVYVVNASTPGTIWRHRASSVPSILAARRRLQAAAPSGGAGLGAKFGNGPASQKLSFDGERERVLSSLALLHAMYPPQFYGAGGKAPVGQDWQGWYPDIFQDGASVSGRTADQEVLEFLREGKIIQAGDGVILPREKFVGKEKGGATDQVGLSAAIAEGPNHRWIGFRGTHGDSGEANIMRLYVDWMVHETRQQYLKQWVGAGFQLTEAQKAAARSTDLLARCAFTVGSKMIVGRANKELDAAINCPKNKKWTQKCLEEKEILLKENGFWPITQRIVRAEVPRKGPKAEDSKEVILAGHSQGGFRAAAASMWLEKVDGKKIRTYSLSGTGTQCCGRSYSYGNKAGLSNDMDTGLLHDQITTYQHPLDMYAGMDYQNGKVCSYGTTKLMDSGPHSIVRNLCQRYVGYSFPQFQMPIFGAPKEATLAAAECRYYAHSLFYAWLLMQDEAVLKSDGTTDGGCADALIVGPGVCPGPAPVARCVGLLASLAIVLLVLLGAGIALLIWWIRRQRARQVPVPYKGMQRVDPGPLYR